MTAGFNPAQLRILAGQDGGGRWIDSEGGDVILIGARGRGSVLVRIGNQTFEATPAQAARYAVANARAEAAAARVAEVDPTWRPQRSLTDPNSIEGQILPVPELPTAMMFSRRSTYSQRASSITSALEN